MTARGDTRPAHLVPEARGARFPGVTPAYLESRIARRIKYSDSIDSQSVLKK